MSWTFKNLQDQVLNWMDEASDTGPTLTMVKQTLVDADVNRWNEQAWPFALASATLTLVAGTASYSLASDFQRPLWFYNSTRQLWLTEVPERSRRATGYQWLVDTDNDKQPFTLRGQVLHTLWIPQSADTVNYDYYKHPTLMSADGSFPNIPYPYSRLLMWDALLDLKSYAKELDYVRLWEKKQEEAHVELLQAYQEEQTVGSQGQYVHQEPE